MMFRSLRERERQSSQQNQHERGHTSFGMTMLMHFCHCAFTPHRWRSSSIAVWLSCSATASHKLLPVTWFQCPQGRVHDICPIWEYIFSCFAHARHVHRISKYTVIHNIKMHKSCFQVVLIDLRWSFGRAFWHGCFYITHLTDCIFIKTLFWQKKIWKKSNIIHPSRIRCFRRCRMRFWSSLDSGLGVGRTGVDLSSHISRCCLHGFCNGFRMGTFCLVVSAVGILHSPTLAAIAIHVYHPFRLIRYQVSNGLAMLLLTRSSLTEPRRWINWFHADVRTWFTADSEAVMAVLATTYFWNIPETFSTSKDETKSIWKSLVEGLLQECWKGKLFL